MRGGSPLKSTFFMYNNAIKDWFYWYLYNLSCILFNQSHHLSPLFKNVVFMHLTAFHLLRETRSLARKRIQSSHYIINVSIYVKFSKVYQRLFVYSITNIDLS